MPEVFTLSKKGKSRSNKSCYTWLVSREKSLVRLFKRFFEKILKCKYIVKRSDFRSLFNWVEQYRVSLTDKGVPIGSRTSATYAAKYLARREWLTFQSCPIDIVVRSAAFRRFFVDVSIPVKVIQGVIFFQKEIFIRKMIVTIGWDEIRGEKHHSADGE